MISWLKKYFIPHEGNDHKPHFLHTKTTRNVIIGLLAIELIVFVLPVLSIKNFDFDGSKLIGSVLPAVLDDLTNQHRQLANLPNLQENTLLDRAAQLKAEDMASKGYFAHTSPEGKTPWYWFDQVGYQYDYAGENLAVNFNDSQDVSTAWMNSPTHKANLLKPVYKEVGTGIASGVYKGQPAIFVAQLYGAPKTIARTAESPNTTETGVTTLALADNQDRTERNQIAQNSIAKEIPEVLGASAAEVSPSVLDKLVASPHHTSNMIFLSVSVIVILSLLIKFSVSSRIKHPDLLINGLLMLVVILGLYLINYRISTQNAEITSGSKLLPVSIIDTKTKIG